MRIGVISDIHSNLYAFKACMQHLEALGCEEYIFLGDYVSDSPYPRECMDYLYSVIETHTCHLLRGNREDYMLAQHDVREGKAAGPEWFPGSASGNILFTYERLNEKDFNFFASLPISFTYKKDGYPDIVCCHGSPENTRELMQFGAENSLSWLRKIDADYLLAAHTHHPGHFKAEGKLHMNSGSCGIAIEDHGFAQCMMLESKTTEKIIWEPSHYKVPYDVDRVVADIYSSGLFAQAPWFVSASIHIYLTGIDKCAELVTLAGELKKEATGQDAQWPYIEEIYFAKAAEQLEIPDYTPRTKEL